MSPSAHIAFGRYLRQLRERAGLSLDRVESLTSSFPDGLQKGYLSRCENGRQSIAFSKLLPLCRVYEVPAEVLVERMELDLELERLGTPEMEGMGYRELADALREASNDGRYWHAVAYARELTTIAASGYLSPTMRDHAEQLDVAWMNYGSVTMKLGKLALARYELSRVRGQSYLGSTHRAILFDRIAEVHRLDGRPEDAVRACDEALEALDSQAAIDLEGFFRSHRALALSDNGQFDEAIREGLLAVELHGKQNRELLELRARINLAEIYVDAKRLNSARRAVDAAKRRAATSQSVHHRALAVAVEAKLQEVEGKPEAAERLLREAINFARRSRNLTLRFQLEVMLLDNVVRQDKTPSIRATRRRLARLAPLVQAALPMERGIKTLPDI